MRKKAINLYFSLFISQLNSTNDNIIPNESLESIAKDLYMTRFQLLPNNIKYIHTTIEALCSYNNNETENELIKKNMNNFNKAAMKITTMLKSIETTNAVKKIFIKDYIEQIVRWAVGPKFTGQYIYYCLKG